MGTDTTEVFTDSDYPLHCKLVGGTITRRDYFAAMAISAAVATAMKVDKTSTTIDTDEWPKIVAQAAIFYADALIAELDKP